MKNTTLLTIASSLLAMSIIGVAAQGCGDDDSATTKTDAATPVTETSTPDTSTGDTSTGGNPPPPAIGTMQIDRMGRPAINTALNHTFDTNATTKNTAKDAYNADSTIAGWKAAYTTQMSSNLAVLDSLDGVCGNAFAASPDAAGPPAVTYPLGGVTADDRLYIKLDAAACTTQTFLAVEGNATGLIPNTDCGGRRLTDDVIDIIYSAAAIGALTGVSDGIDADATKPAGTTFLYLATPVQ